ncbi:hypothetical protein ACXPWS_18825 [Mycobacterium sp. BMJ-28]
MSIRLWFACVGVTGALAAPMLVAVPAHADVCGSVGGRRGHVSVGGCTDIAGAIADWAPPPSEYAPLPEDFDAPPPPPPIGSNVSVCGNVGGPRGRVSVSGCT